MCRAEAGQGPAGLGPGHGMDGVRVGDAADLRKGAIEDGMGSGVRRRPQVSVDNMIVEIDDANLASFGHRSENVYSRLKEEGFEPRYGAGSSAHYDEVFTRPGG